MSDLKTTKIIDSETKEVALEEYYYIPVYRMSGGLWYSGVIMDNERDAVKQLASFTGLKDVKIVKVKLPRLDLERP